MPLNLVLCGRSLRTLAIAFGLFLVTGATAFSAPITYKFSGTLSGSVNGSPFVNASVTIIALGDTNTANTSPTGIACNSLTSVVVVGGTTVPLTDTISVFDNTVHGNAGLWIEACGGPGFDWFRISNNVFNSYNLGTAIGPLSVTPSYTDTTHSINSAAGTILLSGQALNTFQVTVNSAIPTLSEWALIGLTVGLAVLGFLALCRHTA